MDHTGKVLFSTDYQVPYGFKRGLAFIEREINMKPVETVFFFRLRNGSILPVDADSLPAQAATEAPMPTATLHSSSVPGSARSLSYI
jgi:hypothetical protein